MVHPLSQAESDRVYDAHDRAETKKRKRQRNAAQLAIDLRNCDQRIERNHKGAATALQNWFDGDRRALLPVVPCPLCNDDGSHPRGEDRSHEGK